jgi:hypothetical protein
LAVGSCGFCLPLAYLVEPRRSPHHRAPPKLPRLEQDPLPRDQRKLIPEHYDVVPREQQHRHVRRDNNDTRETTSRKSVSLDAFLLVHASRCDVNRGSQSLSSRRSPDGSLLLTLPTEVACPAIRVPILGRGDIPTRSVVAISLIVLPYTDNLLHHNRRQVEPESIPAPSQCYEETELFVSVLGWYRSHSRFLLD